MKIIKLAEEKPENWKEMENWFKKRTDRHIRLVQKWCGKIADYDEERFGKLVERGEAHDQSKFKDPEMDPYVYVAWEYKCKDDGVKWEPPKGIKDKMTDATEHHVNSNAHHPEFHSEKKGRINREDRDKPPAEMVDATKMPDLDVAEMVADWMAMSEEKGNTPKSWADKNVNVRWKFTDEQKRLIYELLDEVWDHV